MHFGDVFKGKEEGCAEDWGEDAGGLETDNSRAMASAFKEG